MLDRNRVTGARDRLRLANSLMSIVLVACGSVAFPSGTALAAEPVICKADLSAPEARGWPTSVESGTGLQSPQPPTPLADIAGEWVSLEGRWTPMARSPFAAQGGLGAWTGEELLVVAKGHAAAYDPEADRWRSLADAPVNLGDGGRDVAVWTGTDLLVWTSSNARSEGYAMDPDANGWEALPSLPSEIEDPVVTGVLMDDHVVVATDRGQVASFDLGNKCWAVLSTGGLKRPAPSTSDVEARPRSLHWTGHELLMTTWHPPVDPNVFPGRSKLWRLSPGGDEWEDTGPTPLTAGWPDGIWTGSRLLFLGGPRDDAGSSQGAAFDPGAGTWEIFEQPCGPSSRDAVWTGTLVMSRWSALDPATGTCLRLPESPGRTRYGPVEVWTGSELIVWSGGQGEELPPKPDGERFRPVRQQ